MGELEQKIPRHKTVPHPTVLAPMQPIDPWGFVRKANRPHDPWCLSKESPNPFTLPVAPLIPWENSDQ